MWYYSFKAKMLFVSSTHLRIPYFNKVLGVCCTYLSVFMTYNAGRGTCKNYVYQNCSVK